MENYAHPVTSQLSERQNRFDIANMFHDNGVKTSEALPIQPPVPYVKGDITTIDDIGDPSSHPTTQAPKMLTLLTLPIFMKFDMEVRNGD